MMKITTIARVCLMLACVVGTSLFGASVSAEDDPTAAGIARYRELIADDNPADLWEARGEEIWKTAAGPKKASFQRCDLGKGPGVIKGAYAELPRYFADTNQVMDLEGRLVFCMTSLQGKSPSEAIAQHFGDGSKHSDLEALSAYIAAASRGMPMAVTADLPQEKAMVALGRQIFFYRAGSDDFSCATCHGQSGTRIRLQTLPNLLVPEGARAAYTTWPAYRVSQGEFRTMQNRLYDCFRQQRFPEPIYGSEVITALTIFMAKNAQGGVFNAPGIKR